VIKLFFPKWHYTASEFGGREIAGFNLAVAHFLAAQKSDEIRHPMNNNAIFPAIIIQKGPRMCV
jgi:hypothetical protein